MFWLQLNQFLQQYHTPPEELFRKIKCLRLKANAQWEIALSVGGHQLERPLQAQKLIIISY